MREFLDDVERTDMDAVDGFKNMEIEMNQKNIKKTLERVKK